MITINLRPGTKRDGGSGPMLAGLKAQLAGMFSGVKEGGEHRSWAWLENPSEEGKMVQALKAGSSMEIKGTSERDTLTTDTYSLKGSSAALKKIDDACK